jgi:hypothetical protein
MEVFLTERKSIILINSYINNFRQLKKSLINIKKLVYFLQAIVIVIREELVSPLMLDMKQQRKFLNNQNYDIFNKINNVF